MQTNPTANTSASRFTTATGRDAEFFFRYGSAKEARAIATVCAGADLEAGGDVLDPSSAAVDATALAMAMSALIARLRRETVRC